MLRKLLLICVFCLCLLTITADEYPAVIFERTDVHTGPGDTYEVIATLGAGVEVALTERNAIGNWLHITTSDDIDGWVMTGFITLPDDLQFSELAIADLPDADTSAILDEGVARLYETPIIAEISENMIEVYERGQELGNDIHVVTKIGDSNSAARPYLPPIADYPYDLGPYDFLQETVEFFADSFQTGSLAARVGLNGFSVFDSIWSNSEQCEPNEYPLACEYRVRQPGIALILFGPNDLRALNTEQYQQQMTRIVEETLAAGIIPVMSTFSSDPDADNWAQAVRFNNILLDVAAQYEVPIINLWSATSALPRRGIGEDAIHLTATGLDVKFNGQESRFGISLQNLLVLYTLDQIRQAIPVQE